MTRSISILSKRDRRHDSSMRRSSLNPSRKPLPRGKGFKRLSLAEVREKQTLKSPQKRLGRIQLARAGSNEPRAALRRGKRRLRAKPDPKMAVWGRQVLGRAGNHCQWPAGCKTGDARIDPHHVAKRSQRPDLKYDPANGIALCRTHHDWTDSHHDEAVAMGLLNTESYELAQRS